MIVAVILLLLALLAYYLSERPRRSRLQCLLPGPRAWPLLGNLLQLDAKKPHKTICEWGDQYGSVFQLYFGRKRVVVAHDYEAIYEALVSNGTDFSGRPDSYRMSFQQQGTGFAFLDPSPEAHALRKLTHKHLKLVGEGMLRIEKLSQEISGLLLERLANTGGAPTDPKEHLYHSTMSMMFLLILGEHFKEGDPEFQQLRDIEDSQNLGLSPGGAGELLDMFPWLRFFGHKTYKLLEHAVRTRHQFWQEFMSRGPGEPGEHGEGGGVAHAMLEAVRHAQQQQHQGHSPPGAVLLNELDVEVAVFNLQVAGVVSTTPILYQFFNVCLHYPEAAQRMRAEVDKLVGDRAVCLDDRDRLHYSRACVLELLRYLSSAPLSIPHKTITDTYLRGHFVPKDTILLPNLWNMHHDPEFWPDPWEYRPERFLDDSGCLVLPDHPNRKHLMPFSAGPRVCVGETMALSRLFLWSTSILQRFDLEAEDPDHLVSCDPRECDVGLGIIPQTYKVRFVDRKTKVE